MIFKNNPFPRFKNIDGKAWELEEWGDDEEDMHEEGDDCISNFLKDISDYRVVEEDGSYILYVR